MDSQLCFSCGGNFPAMRAVLLYSENYPDVMDSGSNIIICQICHDYSDEVSIGDADKIFEIVCIKDSVEEFNYSKSEYKTILGYVLKADE